MHVHSPRGRPSTRSIRYDRFSDSVFRGSESFLFRIFPSQPRPIHRFKTFSSPCEHLFHTLDVETRQVLAAHPPRMINFGREPTGLGRGSEEIESRRRTHTYPSKVPRNMVEDIGVFSSYRLCVTNLISVELCNEHPRRIRDSSGLRTEVEAETYIWSPRSPSCESGL